MAKILRGFEIIEPNKKGRLLKANDGTIITSIPLKDGRISMSVHRPWISLGGVYTKKEADEIFTNWLNPKLRQKKVDQAFSKLYKIHKQSIFKRIIKWLIS